MIIMCKNIYNQIAKIKICCEIFVRIVSFDYQNNYKQQNLKNKLRKDLKQSKQMSNQYEFTILTRKAVRGFLQAISQDGSICVYKNQQNFLVYEFDGESVTEILFTLELQTETILNYSDESPSKYIRVKKQGEMIVLYIMKNDGLEIDKVLLQENGNFDVQALQFDKKVLDMVVHPVEDCLVILLEDSFQIVFGGSSIENYQYPLSFPERENPVVMNGKLSIILEGNSVYYYPSFIRKFASTYDQVIIQKLAERSIAQNYHPESGAVSENTFQADFYEYRTFAYSSKTFVLSLMHVDIDKREKFYKTIYLNDQLTILTIQGEQEIQVFHSFANETSMVKGNDFYEVEDATVSYFYQLCIVPYRTTSSLITFTEDEKQCQMGYFSDFGKWETSGNQYFISQTNLTSLILTSEGFQNQVASLNATFFSTKSPDLLIIQEESELQYVQLKQKVEEVTTEAIPLSMIIVVSALGGLCLVLFICVLYLKCSKNKVESKLANPDTLESVNKLQNVNFTDNAPDLMQANNKNMSSITNPYVEKQGSQTPTPSPKKLRRRNSIHQKDKLKKMNTK